MCSSWLRSVFFFYFILYFVHSSWLFVVVVIAYGRMAQRYKWKIVDKRPKLFGLSASLWRKVCDSIANMKRFQLKLATSQRVAEAATASTATFCIPLCCVWPTDGLCEIKNISTNRWKRSPFVCVLHNNSNTKAHTGANEPSRKWHESATTIVISAPLIGWIQPAHTQELSSRNALLPFSYRIPPENSIRILFRQFPCTRNLCAVRCVRVTILNGMKDSQPVSSSYRM